ncbi:MAG: hypothetical protein H7A25_24520 [Leptospiraceae bacterium]|nr:hypothetical protein [Leptospiraceae bacterium]MCP5503086.1 hypothetical protein [Leptospiraceae bacterium]
MKLRLIFFSFMISGLFWKICPKEPVSQSRVEILKKERKIHGNLFPAGSSLFYDSKKRLKSVRVSGDVKLKKFTALSGTLVLFHPNSRLKGLTLGKDLSSKGKAFHRGDVLRFNNKAKLERARIFTPIEMQGFSLQTWSKENTQKNWLHFYPGGNLRSFPVFIPYIQKGFHFEKEQEVLLHENGSMYRFRLNKEKQYGEILLHKGVDIYLLPDGKLNWEALAEARQQNIWSKEGREKIPSEAETYSDPLQPGSVFRVKKINYLKREEFTFKEKKYEFSLYWNRSLKIKGNRIHARIKLLADPKKEEKEKQKKDKKKKEEEWISGYILGDHKKTAFVINEVLKNPVPHKDIFRLEMKLKLYSRNDTEYIQYQLQTFFRKAQE